MGGGLNLIPEPRLRRRERRRVSRRGLRVVAVYLCLLLGATLAYLAVHRAEPAAAEAGALAVSRDRAEVMRQQVADTGRRLAEAEARLAGARVLAERPDWSTLLRLVGHAAGEDLLLYGFDLTTTGVHPDATATLRIAGVAPDPWGVSQFALRLEDAGLFDRVSIEGSRREPLGERGATWFELTCTLGGDAGEETR
ncbi:MAG: hypothetical protein AAF800_00305 [Planctomycetota bacterium]